MKRSLLMLCLLAGSALSVQAKQLYNIHLTNSEVYTNCTIIADGSTTQFRGTDKSGKVVTKTVDASNVLLKKPVAAPAKTKKDKAADTPAETTEPAAETTTEATDAPAAEGAAEGTDGEAAAPAENSVDRIEAESVEHAKDATLRLRQQLESIDQQLAALTKPSRSLTTSANSTKSRVERQLADMDRLALEVASLQQKFHEAGSGAYNFTEVTADQRDAYMRDGTAAYKAMVVDMKEKKGRRKVGGLDKFEVMRDRYQGVTEYKQAYDWYLKTLRDLSTKWKKMLATEQGKRKNLPPAKKQAMADADEQELEKLGDLFRKDGEDIATVWYTPSARNEAMLRNCVNKVEDALRRNKDRGLDPAVGTVPNLISQYWTAMDKARHSMMTGDLDGAEATLQNDGSYKVIIRLKPALLPNEYVEPLKQERSKMLNEIKKRQRDYQTTKRSLETKSGQLERMIGAAQAQIDNTLSQIERERDLDAGEKTAERTKTVEEEEEEELEAAAKAADAKPADAPDEGETPAEGADKAAEAEE